MEVVGCIALVTVGILLGLLGGGGSMLAVPVLIYLFRLDIVTATGYSLFIVGSTSLMGIFLKHQDRLIDFKTGVAFGAPSLAITFAIRKWMLDALPNVMLSAGGWVLTKRTFVLLLFSILVLISSAVLLSGRRDAARGGDFQIVPLLLVGVGVGFVSGIAGMGGGFLILPSLILFGRLSFKSAAGTALLVIAMNSLAGFMGDVLTYGMQWSTVIPLAMLAIAGMLLGHYANRRVQARALQKSFGWITLLIGVAILVRELV